MPVPLQFASFHCSQEVFIRPDGVSNSRFHFLIGYVISVRDTEEFAECVVYLGLYVCGISGAICLWYIWGYSYVCGISGAICLWYIWGYMFVVYLGLYVMSVVYLGLYVCGISGAICLWYIWGYMSVVYLGLYVCGISGAIVMSVVYLGLYVCGISGAIVMSVVYLGLYVCGMSGAICLWYI